MTGRTASATILLACLLVGGCSGGEERGASGPPKLALIGWDGATWDVIDPMLRRGELPNVARLLDNGSRATLLFDPPLFSPVVWTTLATGFPPEEHGIRDFLLPALSGTGQVLASTLHRKKAPLWTMVSSQGKSAGVVGWWTTWPADPVNGYLISDHLAYNRYDDWAERAGGSGGAGNFLTWPEQLAGELRSSAITPAQVDAGTMTALIPFDTREQQEMMQADAPVKFHAPSVARFAYATDASNVAFARKLLDTREQPDLFGVVFILSDVAGHVFWHHYEPHRTPGMAESGDTHLAAAIPNVYRQLDRWTGEILDRLEPGTTVILLSDHGMGSKGRLPTPGINPAGDHNPRGIFAISGDRAPHGTDLGVIRSLDFAPTVLALLGLPVGGDMPGRVATAVFPAGNPPTLRAIQTYGDGRSDARPASPSPGEDEYLERLRSLGYIN